jgi:hypothetical protein
MVKGRVWKPRSDGFWHWQLIYFFDDARRHARVYSGFQREWAVAHAEMRLQHVLHSGPTVTKPPLIILGVDTPKVA